MFLDVIKDYFARLIPQLRNSPIRIIGSNDKSICSKRGSTLAPCVNIEIPSRRNFKFRLLQEARHPYAVAGAGKFQVTTSFEDGVFFDLTYLVVQPAEETYQS